MDEKTRKVLEECEKFIDESTHEELAAYEDSLIVGMGLKETYVKYGEVVSYEV